MHGVRRDQERWEHWSDVREHELGPYQERLSPPDA